VVTHSENTERRHTFDTVLLNTGLSLSSLFAYSHVSQYTTVAFAVSNLSAMIYEQTAHKSYCGHDTFIHTFVILLFICQISEYSSYTFVCIYQELPS